MTPQGNGFYFSPHQSFGAFLIVWFHIYDIYDIDTDDEGRPVCASVSSISPVLIKYSNLTIASDSDTEFGLHNDKFSLSLINFWDDNNEVWRVVKLCRLQLVKNVVV